MITLQNRKQAVVPLPLHEYLVYNQAISHWFLNEEVQTVVYI